MKCWIKKIWGVLAIFTILSMAVDVWGDKAEEERLNMPRISANRAALLLQSGKAILADTMNPQTFRKYHILGAINLPTDSKENREKWKAAINFPKNIVIILY